MSLTAVLAYLLPIGVVLACRARRARPLWATALDIPLAVACDLLLVLTLSWLMTAEVATFVARALWLAGGVAYLVASRARAVDRPAWPCAADARTVTSALVAATTGAWVSTLGSRPYSIWDRGWHTPLVASVRGQKLPFENVFAKGEALHYHFAGDVHAAMIQSLSFDTLHSSLALSIAHDILFGLIGATVALLLAGLTKKRGALLAAATTVALVLAGPFTIGRDRTQPHVDGYSVLNYFSLSFRPHDALAGLFYVGIVGALAARVWGGQPRGRVSDTAVPLLACTAGLGISDEATLGLLGLSIGLTWLLFPAVLHPRRAGGVAILAGMLVAFIAPNVAFGASIAPGAQHYAVAIVPWRTPGCYTPSLPLTDLRGLALLAWDLGPCALLTLGAALAASATNRPRVLAMAILAGNLFVLSMLALTRVEVNHEALESHRFMTGEVFLAPLLALLALRDPAPIEASPARRRLGVIASIAGVALGTASTADWIARVLPARGHHHDHFYTQEDLYAIDCRHAFGTTLGAHAEPRYMSESIWYAYAGCQPSFAPARRHAAQWALTIGGAYFDKDEVRNLRARGVAPDEDMNVICQRKPTASTDSVCTFARKMGRCEDLGERLTRCVLTPAQQATIANAR